MSLPLLSYIKKVTLRQPYTIIEIGYLSRYKFTQNSQLNTFTGHLKF